MKIRANFVCASIMFAGLTSSLLGQAPATPVSALPPPSGQQPVQAQTSGSTANQTPAAPPQVTFQDGRLAIRAENSTLGDVLRAVHDATGATIDSPGLSSERVYVNLGPGEPRDILASLLNGSHYDYILMGSPQAPNSLARVMLTTRQAASAQPASAPAQAVPRPVQQPENDQADINEMRDREVTTPPVQPPQPTPVQQPPANNGNMNRPTVGQQIGQPIGQPIGTPIGQPAGGQQQVKTPQQLLQEMQQQQQQQQQQRQSQ
jgi:hypothetical protein